MAARPRRFRPSRRAAKVGIVRLRYPPDDPIRRKKRRRLSLPRSVIVSGIGTASVSEMGSRDHQSGPVPHMLGAEEAVPTVLFTGYSHRSRVSRGEHKMLWRFTAVIQDDEDQGA